LVLPSISSEIPEPHTGHAYPRPLLRRADWTPLNGEWDFALDNEARCSRPEHVAWTDRITIPFAIETKRGGIGNTGFFRRAWYRRRVEVRRPIHGSRLLLHFGAVDHKATVWLGRAVAGHHEGGYTPFTIDATDFVSAEGPLEIVVCADDDPADLAKPRGKQDWQLEPHSIWYPRTSGIWQTVWLEEAPRSYIDQLKWSSSLERWDIGLDASIAGEWREGLRLSVRLTVKGRVLSHDSYTLTSSEISRRIVLTDPGIDDSRNELLWSPESPTLIAADIDLWGEREELIDRVQSYTAIRSVETQGDRLLLNGRPYPLRLVLDQGYWPDTGMTSPDDAALRRDVELAKTMGFNGVRKHQKVEEPRFLYWADVLGLLVWEEMPSAYRFTCRSVDRLMREWTEVMARDASHPCIAAWVPFNESWGAPNLPANPAERHYVRSVYHLTKTLDPSRPVIGNDGWESVATDVIGIHDYDTDPERISRRYHADDVRPRLFRRERPGGRLLVLENQPPSDLPIVLSEFGGIAYANRPGTWGYSRCSSPEEFAARYGDLLACVRSLDMLCGFCYTQFADTYQEANGLLYADRTPKFPIEQIAQATRGTGRQPQAVASTPDPQAGSPEAVTKE
jgi:beta-galactosidase/beta-glucuronidase